MCLLLLLPVTGCVAPVVDLVLLAVSVQMFFLVIAEFVFNFYHARSVNSTTLVYYIDFSQQL